MIDAGPFPDIATLGAFEQALAGVKGVDEAVVRSFEGNRALVDVTIRAGVSLELTLPAQLPFAVEVTPSAGGGLAVHLRSGA